MKQRTHNEWFRPVSLGNRKSCPTCHKRLLAGESIWSWGEYRIAKWRTIKHFCYQCFRKEVLEPLLSHTDDCGCRIELCSNGSSLPMWLRLPSDDLSEHDLCVMQQIVDSLERRNNETMAERIETIAG